MKPPGVPDDIFRFMRRRVKREQARRRTREQIRRLRVWASTRNSRSALADTRSMRGATEPTILVGFHHLSPNNRQSSFGGLPLAPVNAPGARDL